MSFFGQVKNLLLPPASQQMRWQPIEIDMASGQQEISLAYAISQGNGLVPQSIIINSTKITGSAQLIWDTGGINFPINIPANIQSTFPVPAVDKPTFTIVPAADATGTLRIDMLNFPELSNNFIVPDSQAGQNVTVSNGATNPVPVSNATLSALVNATGNTQAASGLTVYATPFISGSPVTSGSPMPVADVSLNGLVSASQTASGLTTHSSLYAQAATLVSGSASASGSTIIGTPPAGSNLRKLVLSIPDDATLAAAGDNQISVQLDGVTIFSDSVYVPAAALANAGQLYRVDIPFTDIAFNAAAGDLAVTIETALATSHLWVNAYFD